MNTRRISQLLILLGVLVSVSACAVRRESEFPKLTEDEKIAFEFLNQ